MTDVNHRRASEAKPEGEALISVISAGTMLREQLRAHQENTGEELGSDDAALVRGAEEDLEAARALLGGQP